MLCVESLEASTQAGYYNSILWVGKPRPREAFLENPQGDGRVNPSLPPTLCSQAGVIISSLSCLRGLLLLCSTRRGGSLGPADCGPFQEPQALPLPP